MTTQRTKPPRLDSVAAFVVALPLVVVVGAVVVAVEVFVAAVQVVVVVGAVVVAVAAFVVAVPVVLAATAVVQLNADLVAVFVEFVLTQNHARKTKKQNVKT